MNKKSLLVLIKIPYWLGIIADSLWSIALFTPQLFRILAGVPDFNPNLQVRLIMAIGGFLMTGWTLLLLWAVREPIERKGVILLTAFPVVFGLFILSLIGFLEGNTFNIWIMAKTLLLFFSMIASYIIAGKMQNIKE